MTWAVTSANREKPQNDAIFRRDFGINFVTIMEKGVKIERNLEEFRASIITKWPSRTRMPKIRLPRKTAPAVKHSH
ncbi:hypothetical protein HMSSN139_04220 [Paenibacillus sp. HMSSN-139]|nr:hypothetical protein HMSSN139_04220 [Paenibacillus sp. HMSSN-139]